MLKMALSLEPDIYIYIRVYIYIYREIDGHDIHVSVLQQLVECIHINWRIVSIVLCTNQNFMALEKRRMLARNSDTTTHLQQNHVEGKLFAAGECVVYESDFLFPRTESGR